jgi:hypothetical protein
MIKTRQIMLAYESQTCYYQSNYYTILELMANKSTISAVHDVRMETEKLMKLLKLKVVSIR